MLSLVIHAMLGLPILQADPSSVANYSSVAGRVLRQMPDPRKSRCEGKNRTQPLPTPPPPLAASYIEAFAPLSKEADPEALLGATVSPWMRTALRAWSGAHFNTARRQLTHGLCHLSVGTVQVSDDKEPEIEMARVTLSSKPGQPDEPWRIGTTKRYEIASNTKVFTSILAQALVNDGLFKWTDKIGDHLPIGKWPYRPRDRSILDITLEQLASHSAGLMDSSPFMPDRTKINQFSGFTLDQMLKALTDVSRFRARPTGGGNFKYSNWGFGLLGYILENSTNTFNGVNSTDSPSYMTYGDLLSKHIFEPLNMTDSDGGNICTESMSLDECQAAFLGKAYANYWPKYRWLSKDDERGWSNQTKLAPRFSLKSLKERDVCPKQDQDVQTVRRSRRCRFDALYEKTDYASLYMNVLGNRFDPYGIMKGQGSMTSSMPDMLKFIAANIKAMRNTNPVPSDSSRRTMTALLGVLEYPYVVTDDLSHHGRQSLTWGTIGSGDAAITWKTGGTAGTTTAQLFNAETGRGVFIGGTCGGANSEDVPRPAVWKTAQSLGRLILSGPPERPSPLPSLGSCTVQEGGQCASPLYPDKGCCVDGLACREKTELIFDIHSARYATCVRGQQKKSSVTYMAPEVFEHLETAELVGRFANRQGFTDNGAFDPRLIEIRRNGSKFELWENTVGAMIQKDVNIKYRWNDTENWRKQVCPVPLWSGGAPAHRVWQMRPLMTHKVTFGRLPIEFELYDPSPRPDEWDEPEHDYIPMKNLFPRRVSFQSPTTFEQAAPQVVGRARPSGLVISADGWDLYYDRMTTRPSALSFNPNSGGRVFGLAAGGGWSEQATATPTSDLDTDEAQEAEEDACYYDDDDEGGCVADGDITTCVSCMDDKTLLAGSTRVAHFS